MKESILKSYSLKKKIFSKSINVSKKNWILTDVKVFSSSDGIFEKKQFNKDYLELPEYIKQNKWYVNIDGFKFYVPKGFEIGTFFAGIIEKTAMWIAQDDPEAWIEFLKDFTIEKVYPR